VPTSIATPRPKELDRLARNSVARCWIRTGE
jgi:hypothetical protein